MKNVRVTLLIFCVLGLNSARAQFIKEMFKGSNQPVSLHAIVPVNNTPTSNLYISGTFGSQIVVGEYKQNGTAVWMKKLMIEDSNYTINSMIRDSDGNLILCGGKYTGVDDNGFGFLIKFNPLTKNLLWHQKTNQNILFFDCAEMGIGGNYIVGGQDESIGTGSAADHITFEVDRTTGNFTLFTNFSANVNENVDAMLFDESSGSVYTTGRYELNPGGSTNFRICLDKINALGDVEWTKYYINATGDGGRFYPKDILQDGDNLIIVGCGDNTGTNSVKNFYMLKVSLDGELVWVNKYDLTGTTNDGIFCSVQKHGEGYIVSGSLYAATYTDMFLMNTNFDGDINWAKSYPYRKKTGAFGMQMTSALAVIGSNVFHVGEKEMEGGAVRGILLRTTVASGDVGSCDIDIPITKSTIVDAYQGNYTMTPTSLTATFTSLFPIVKNQSFNQTITCTGNGNGTKEWGEESTEVTTINGISLYPNPTGDFLNVEIENFDNNSTNSVSIIDVSGRVITRVVASENITQFEVYSLPAGVYLVVIQIENNINSFKFIKN